MSLLDSAISTCEISDALVKLGHKDGGLIPDIIPQYLPELGRICGRAYTVQMVSGENTDAPSLSEHFVDTAPAKSIIVISSIPEYPNASWGGLMSAGAKAREAVGVIIDGRCRDINEHKALGFPVFSRGRSTIGQSPWVRPSTINTSIRMSSIDVNPGDWIVADEDGVVRVPPVLEAQVVELALKGQEVDALCMEAIQKGEGIKASFKKFRGK